MYKEIETAFDPDQTDLSAEELDRLKQKVWAECLKHRQVYVYKLVALTPGPRPNFGGISSTGAPCPFVTVLPGQVVKYGITMNRSRRYTRSFYQTHDVIMELLPEGCDKTSDECGMTAWEAVSLEKIYLFQYRILPERHKPECSLIFPPLNTNAG